MLKLRRKSESSSSAEVDFFNLCKHNVRSIEDLASGGNLLNHRQCRDLSSKLSQTTQSVGELVLQCGAPASLFRPALENLFRYLEKAKVLVSNCAEEDWCAAAVFQCQNESAFREILLGVSLCYNAIYELAKSKSEDWNDPPEDLRLSLVFLPASDSDVDGDKQDLQKRLDELASGYTSVKLLDYFVPGRVARRRSLAKYLLVKMYCTSLEPQASTLDTYSAILWTKVSEPSGTWGNSRFLGAGSGAIGVYSTEWLGIPCAKKEFHGQESESSFLKEAGILAHLKHPCIVNFICCGNGLERGDRFITIELMEKSLFDLIKEQKDAHFSVPVAVDMMVQIARGVCYLHSRGVAHRDLKPQNVVVNQLSAPPLVDHFCVKLVDFGMSKTKVEASKVNTISHRGVGTRMYRAPEIHPLANPDGEGSEGKVNWLKADAFSFAMTCAHLLSLKTPFKDIKPSELYTELTKNARRPKLHEMCSQDLVVLLEDCWKTNPCLRPNFVEICTRLETYRHKCLRGAFTLDQGLPKDKSNFGVGFDFIKMKLESSVQSLLDDEVGDKRFDLQVPILPCTCGHALECIPQPPHKSFACNLCMVDDHEELYRCETCDFDAHLDCAKVKDEVKVFFHIHPLRLHIRNYYNDNPHAICRFCEELVQHNEWVYRCEQCDFDVHALCTKYPMDRMWHPLHRHSLTLIQCPPHKSLSCACCNGKVRGNTSRYSCTERWCAFDVHPTCAILSLKPLCIFDNSHQLDFIQKLKGFYCSRCGALGFSWFYHCNCCDVDIHLDCINDIGEEQDNWNEAYEKFMLEYGAIDDHVKMGMITQLLDKLIPSDTLDGSSSSTSKPPPGTMRVQPTIRRLASSEKPGLDAFDDVDLHRKIGAETEERKAKKMTAKGERQKLKAKSLEMLENLEKIVVDLQSSRGMLEADAEMLTATHEKLKKRKYIVEEEMAMQVQSKIRHGPRICLFYLRNEGRRVFELLTSLRADTENVHLTFICEEPGHQHFVDGSFCRRYNGLLGEEQWEKLQPLLASGLQVVTSCMSTLAEQPTQLDCVTLPKLGTVPWDLRTIDLEQHGKPSKDNENVGELKRTEDSAVEWVLSELEKGGVNIYESRRLLRIRYMVTEQGNCPRYTRGTLAWLCTEHLNRGLEAGILQSYPLKYHNRELN